MQKGKSLRPEFNFRLLNGVSEEVEWHYLLNETYIGEIRIVPLLRNLLNHPAMVPAFRPVIGRQIDEELDHIFRYERLLASCPLTGSGYAAEFSAYVNSLPSLTLRVFALQSILEGISLGSLEYRLLVMSVNPAKMDDTQIRSDEVGHTRFGFAFLRNLIVSEGRLSISEFARVSKDVNAIFARFWRGDVIQKAIAGDYGLNIASGDEIDASIGMKMYIKSCVKHVLCSKKEFIERYQNA